MSTAKKRRGEGPVSGSGGGGRSQYSSVRRAVILPTVAGDAGETLGTLTARRSAAQSSETAPRTGSPTHADRHSAGRVAGQGPRTGSGRNPESTSRPEETSLRTGTYEGRGTTVVTAPTAVSEPATTARPDAITLADADGLLPPGGGTADSAGTARSKGMMLAAVASVGAVLIVVPLLLTGSSEDNDGGVTDRPKDTLLVGGGKVEGAPREFVTAPDEEGPSRRNTPGGPAAEPREPQGERVIKIPPPDDRDQTDDSSTQAMRSNPAKWPHQKPRVFESKRTNGTVSRSRPSVEYGWETSAHALTNMKSGTCLVKDTATDRRLKLSTCGSDTWRRYFTEDKSVLLKHVQANRCLDTNGKDLYLSSCTTADPGQHWNTATTSQCHYTIWARGGVQYLTGWNDGSVSASAKSTVDVYKKSNWRVPTFGQSC